MVSAWMLGIKQCIRITYRLCRHFRLSFSCILITSFVIISFQPFRDCSY